jgi:hypothetical protein
MQSVQDLLRLDALRDRLPHEPATGAVLWPDGWGEKRFERAARATRTIAKHSRQVSDRMQLSDKIDMALLESLERDASMATRVPLWRVIAAVGARGVGRVTATNLARHYGSLHNLLRVVLDGSSIEVRSFQTRLFYSLCS